MIRYQGTIDSASPHRPRPEPVRRTDSTQVAGDHAESALYEGRDATMLESHRYAFNHSRAANHLHSHAFDFVLPSASASYSKTTAIVLRRFHFSDSDSK